MVSQGFFVHYCPLDYLGIKTQGMIAAIRNKNDKVVKKLLSNGGAYGNADRPRTEISFFYH